jgi:hypothetical protein
MVKRPPCAMRGNNAGPNDLRDWRDRLLCRMKYSCEAALVALVGPFFLHDAQSWSPAGLGCSRLASSRERDDELATIAHRQKRVQGTLDLLAHWIFGNEASCRQEESPMRKQQRRCLALAALLQSGCVCIDRLSRTLPVRLGSGGPGTLLRTARKTSLSVGGPPRAH